MKNSLHTISNNIRFNLFDDKYFNEFYLIDSLHNKLIDEIVSKLDFIYGLKDNHHAKR